jgi:hypothetical protein
MERFIGLESLVQNAEELSKGGIFTDLFSFHLEKTLNQLDAAPQIIARALVTGALPGER